jgi:uncharacterized protein YcfJ
MTVGIFGAVTGCLMGAVMGGALFGPVGAGAGVALGGLLGALAVRFFYAGFAEETAKRPYTVTCPDCKEPVRVFLEPNEASKAALLGDRHRVRECSRWKGEPGCERQCENQILL